MDESVGIGAPAWKEPEAAPRGAGRTDGRAPIEVPDEGGISPLGGLAKLERAASLAASTVRGLPRPRTRPMVAKFSAA
jgi:hypothetical protein